MLKLSTSQRRSLAARAHHINPIVIIGKDGLSVGVMSELDKGLSSHELIKIKILNGDRKMRTLLLEQVCQQLNALPINHIGRILVIYRPETEEKRSTTEASHMVKKKP
ncbi:ribosome assembly RNA-binding protein YhbY [Nitrosomonas sp. Nm132]|jgi:RNA-binding protein|uniref:ribosome assembly RNA-binding protein YhbY n=1 Tax=Nitrosomonas sp. Nm132 TaxID=1881053 RepID=UPI00088E226B|nr:ribosome assembly RNA-binding protein YhbY [Nitrosomonas sp. Nm132]SDH92553.1 RNA-binding protein [Nitrosomonas sp. Nm132]